MHGTQARPSKRCSLPDTSSSISSSPASHRRVACEPILAPERTAAPSAKPLPAALRVEDMAARQLAHLVGRPILLEADGTSGAELGLLLRQCGEGLHRQLGYSLFIVEFPIRGVLFELDGDPTNHTHEVEEGQRHKGGQLRPVEFFIGLPETHQYLDHGPRHVCREGYHSHHHDQIHHLLRLREPQALRRQQQRAADGQLHEDGARGDPGRGHVELALRPLADHQRKAVATHDPKGHGAHQGAA
mmetsp:Transcript_75634/g.245922  ORF Transcript_75634/g.245922 Transcript_75634/m.245922 type:complete len:244 (+) Transcript_75634:143-874(+)